METDFNLGTVHGSSQPVRQPFLYYRMNAMLTQKADSINALHLATLSNQINDALVNLSDIGNLCASDMQVVTALEWRGSSAAAKQALEAQNRLNAYLASSPVGKNIYQITAFNTDGRFISGNGQTYGTMQDYMLITAQSVYQRMAAQTAPNGVVGGGGLAIVAAEHLVKIAVVLEADLLGNFVAVLIAV